MTDGYIRRAGLAAAACLAALALAGCQTDGPRSPSAAKSGTTSGSRVIAFESIDGPPQPVFEKLVSSLSTEADGHRLRIVSREADATYRVRGYLAASVEDGKGTVDWAWDVFDASRTRVVRISGSEPLGKGSDVWARCDQAVLDRIAAQSLDGIAARLDGNPTPDPAPAATPTEQPTPVDPADAGVPVAAGETTPPPLAFAAP